MFARVILLLTAALLPALVHAADYPTKSVKVVVPFPAGSSTDLIGREVAQILSTGTGQSFIVNNMPGAQSTLGAGAIAHAPADGYSLLIGTTTSQSAAPSLMKNVPYNPAKDFTPITRVGAVVFAVLVRADLPVKTVRELMDYGVANPGKLNWAYANAANQVAGSAVVHAGKFTATGVPYKGVPQIITDLVGGQLDFAVTDLTVAAAYVKSGKLRALAVTSEKELPLLPGVPPISTAIPGFSIVGYYGLFAPAGTPQPIVESLNKILLKGLEDPEFAKRLEVAGMIPYPAGPAELDAYVASEATKWARLAAEAGIQPE
ncbi:tripartite tricarboxylate transporter substrate binding protein [soil metagenome]